MTLLTEKKLVGKHATMSLAHDSTPVLWKSFMPQRKHLLNLSGPELFCIQVYGNGIAPDFSNFRMDTLFEKWAAMEVQCFDSIPEGMDAFTLPAGLYAVFLHKGASSDFERTFDAIFNQWLPGSDYVIDKRPHFELLDERYIHNSPLSEEEIWIPVKAKV